MVQDSVYGLRDELNGLVGSATNEFDAGVRFRIRVESLPYAGFDELTVRTGTADIATNKVAFS